MPADRAIDRQDITVAAILLAAGKSQRFAGSNKLLVEISGEPMIRRVARRIALSQAQPLFVVTGHQAAAVEAALGEIPAVMVNNPDYRQGLASSLVRGLAALPQQVAGVLVCLADMPGLTTRLIDDVVAVFASQGGRNIVHVLRPGGGPGHPVAWPRTFFPELGSLTGDQGGRDLIRKHAGCVFTVDCPADDVLVDIDTDEELHHWQAMEH